MYAVHMPHHLSISPSYLVKSDSLAGAWKVPRGADPGGSGAGPIQLVCVRANTRLLHPGPANSPFWTLQSLPVTNKRPTLQDWSCVR